MHLFRQTLLLFTFNLVDALLTILWVNNGIASEGNQLMARLLDGGTLQFLGVKVAIGVIAAFVLLRWGYFSLARYGVSVALAVYVSVMGIHLFTALAAFGQVSQSFLVTATQFAQDVAAMLI
jgi:hypothetical protein